MKKIIFKIFLLIMLFVIFSCAQQLTDLQDKSNEKTPERFVAEEVGDALINEENGATEEVGDLLNIFSEKKITTHRTIVITTEDGELVDFTWNPDTKSYKRTGENLGITTEHFSGTINNFSAEVWFYLTEDATGESVELTETTREQIKSMKYQRIINASVTHEIRDITRDVNINLSFIVTGINDDIEGFLITGIRTADVEVTNGDYTGEWTLIHEFENVNATREKDGDTVYQTFEGTVHVTFDGTYSGPSGTLTVTKDAVVNFTRERTVKVTIDGTTIIIDIVTNTIIG